MDVMQLLDWLMAFMAPKLDKAATDLSAGRMIESLVLLYITLNRVKPHLKKIEDRLEGLEKTLQTGFNSGEQRFSKIEVRLNALEKPKPIEGGFSETISAI